MAGRLSARHSRVPLSEMHSALLALQNSRGYFSIVLQQGSTLQVPRLVPWGTGLSNYLTRRKQYPVPPL